MLKAVVAATAAVTIAGSTFAYAQRNEPDQGTRRWQPTMEDMRAFQAARLAALRAGLVLSAEQEQHWPAFEQAMRELQQLRLNRLTAFREARRDGRPPVADPAERMRDRAARLAESGAVLKRLAEATEPLYRSLDDAQKRRFAILARMPGQRGWQRRGRDGGDGGMPRGHHRTEAVPADTTRTFVYTTRDGDVFAQAFAAKSDDNVVVGRILGAKTENGDLMVGEAALFAGKSLIGDTARRPTAFSGKVAPIAPDTFGRKITIGEPPLFGRKTVSNI